MKSFIGLIVRCKDEPYVSEFVSYYINQGVDKIFIVDDNSNKEIYNGVETNDKVEILFADNNISTNPWKSRRINQLYDRIRDKFEWIIYVDMDEYITTKKNSSNTIRNELETTFKHAHCIKIPWVMMSCNSIEQNPISLLTTNIYRWNHNKRHPNKVTSEHKFRCRYDSIECKSIFKPRYFDDISDHIPKDNKQSVKVVESIHCTPQQLDVFYPGLRESHIQEGYMLCYHYRIISIENCENKIMHNCWYRNYSLNDLLSTDYPEIRDETMKNKQLGVVYPHVDTTEKHKAAPATATVKPTVTVTQPRNTINKFFKR